MQASLTDCVHGPDAIYDGRIDVHRARPRVADKRDGVILADRSAFSWNDDTGNDWSAREPVRWPALHMPRPDRA